MGPNFCDAEGRGKAADQPSRLRLLGPAVRRVNSGQAFGISAGEVVVAEGEEI